MLPNILQVESAILIDGAKYINNEISRIIGIIENNSYVIIGHEKGRGTKDKMYRNFGMAKPEGYRKALRLMKLGEKFNIPIISLIDTPGAYPGIGAEERGQSQAIANNLYWGGTDGWNYAHFEFRDCSTQPGALKYHVRSKEYIDADGWFKLYCPPA